MTTIRKDILAVAPGDQFRLCQAGERRQVIRTRGTMIPFAIKGGAIERAPGIEVMHGKVNHPGNLAYLHVPHGSQLAILIP